LRYFTFRIFVVPLHLEKRRKKSPKLDRNELTSGTQTLKNIRVVAKLSKIFYFTTTLIVLSTFLTFGVSAEVKDASLLIRGKVIDEKTHEALIGASVFSKEQNTGAVTDAEGNFSLQAKEFPIELTVNYVGYKKAELKVDSDTSRVDVALSELSDILNEVVVVGYGSQRRKELTGSVAKIGQSYLDYNISLGVDALMSGAVAGMNVTQESGQPGTGSNIRIRGGTSVYASNEPLYVIDGFIFFNEEANSKTGVTGIDGSLNPLSLLNPADIESIEVLKDVSAKAIYGSRGANGVIIVTTKKGVRSENRVNYNYTAGVSNSTRRLELLDAQQWVAFSKKYFNNYAGSAPEFGSPEAAAALGKGYDWQDAVLQTGLAQTHQLSVGGGDEKTRYHFSGNYSNQKGIILNSGYERLGGRLNLETKIRSLTIGGSLTANKSVQNALTTFDSSTAVGNDTPFGHGIANSLTYALYLPPVIPIYDTNGDYNHRNPYEAAYLAYYGIAANPVADLENSIAETSSVALLGNIFAHYKIIDGLFIKVNAGTNINYITQTFFAPSFTALGFKDEIKGLASIGNRRTNVSQSEYLLTYAKRLNDTHSLDALAGYTNQVTETNFMLASATHLGDSFENLAAGIQSPTKTRPEEGSLHSFLGRINYSLLEKYNLTATYRADKSSRFSAGNRWGYFPSIGLSWVVSDEKFLTPIYSVLPSLKLRLTYGTTGNQEIGYSDYDQYFQIEQIAGGNAYVMTTTNKNLKWETTTEYNAGIDAELIDKKISITADVYKKITNDLLFKVPPPLGSPTTYDQLTNLGNVENKGFEFAVTAYPVNRRDLKLTVSANIAHNKNTITDMGSYNNRELYNKENVSDEIIRLMPGESVGSFWGYVFDGVVQTGDDVSKVPTTNSNTPRPGDAKFVDFNGDGKITADADRTVIGSIQPDFTYGLSATLIYRNFDLFAAFHGSQGNEVYNLLRRYLEGRPEQSYNSSAALLNAWTEDNPSNTIPSGFYLRDRNIRELDSRFVEDASFFRLRNLTIGYQLPVKFIHQARIYLSVQNLFTLTRYKGYDPEVASGIDLGNYPMARTFSIGANISY